MSRKVFLAREFNWTLDELASLNEESNGVLLYRRQSDYLPVEAIFMTGRGTEGHVRADQRRMDVVNEFFARNTDYQFVKFHTHSNGTIRKYGDFYATHFSDGDTRSYEEQLRDNSDFIGMVVTPRTKLLYAPDNPTIQVVNGFPNSANQRIHQELAEIARSMGYELEPFTMTRRR